MQCEHCGEIRDVVAVMAYVGGRGHEARQRCAELFQCWARWDRQQEHKDSRPAVRSSRAA